MRLVHLGDVAVSRMNLEPGWCWSRDVAPIAGTSTCDLRHVGYVIAGSLLVRMDDGTEMVLSTGDAYEIPPGHDARVVGDELFDTVEFTSGHVFAKSPEEIGKRFLATIVFTDIVDSTRILERVGDQEWSRLLLAHNEGVRAVIDRYQGREIATLGDGFFAIFDGAARAVQAAAEIGPAVSPLGLQVRIGVHTGEVEISGDQPRGLAVHAAARVAGLSDGGEVLVSGMTHDLIDGSTLKFVHRGNFELKGISGERAIYSLEG